MEARALAAPGPGWAAAPTAAHVNQGSINYWVWAPFRAGSGPQGDNAGDGRGANGSTAKGR